MVDLNLLNKWWKGKEYIEQDKHILDFKEKKYQWIPEILKELDLKPDNIFNLLGPRQVGKTTLIKLFIKELLKKVDEKSIFFWNCDELVDFRELSLLLKEYLAFAKSYGIKSKFIFLDEISRVRDWQRAIKFLADAGELKDCCIFLTGSHTLDLKYGIDRLPGRTGRFGKEIILLPLRFSEFVSLAAPEISSKLKKIKNFSSAEIHKSIASAKLYDSELKMMFEKYLITGGFPLAINEFLTNKKIPDFVIEIYYKWVVG
ncbi:MAG: ATP-binding protein, partial [Nanoarchaeota archaeon]